MRLISRHFYPVKPKIPAGSVFIKTDDQGRHIYRAPSGHWFVLMADRGGWDVSEIEHSTCPCGG